MPEAHRPRIKRERRDSAKDVGSRGEFGPVPWIAVALFLVTLAVYLPSLGHQFIDHYDDDLYVTGNPNVQQGIRFSSLCWALTGSVAFNWHPLTVMSHMLDVQLYGLNPVGHHLTNILLHALAVVLLFLMLLRLTRARHASALAAALFALHPMHVESVAWVAERKDVLSACFWFLTTLAYVRYTEKPGPRRYGLVLILFALGLMAKPMLVTLPFTLLLLDYWPLSRVPGNAPVGKVFALIKEKLPLFALSAAVSVVTFLVQRATGAMADSTALPLADRVANALVSYAAYVGKLIWITDYAVIYPHRQASPPAWQLGGALVSIVVVTAAVLWQARRSPHFLVGWFWYLGTLVPVIGLVQVGAQSMADRYSYIPSVGLSIMLVWGLAPRAVRGKGRAVAIAASTVLLAGLALATTLQLGYWRDSETLFRRAIEVTENNYTANYALGTTLAEQGRLAEAETYLTEAVRLLPNDVRGHKTLGQILLAQNKLAAAIDSFATIERLEPGNGSASYTMGLILERMGRTDESAPKLDKAIDDFRKLLEKAPEDPTVMLSLAVALDHRGRAEEALPLYQEALRRKPDLLPASQAEGLVRRLGGQ